MYCKKCGKFIYNDDDYCSDCAPTEAPAAAPIVEAPTPEPIIESAPIAEPVCTPVEPSKTQRQGRVMDGFGPALTSVILSSQVATPLAVAAYFLSVLFLASEDRIQYVVASIICAVYIVIAIALAIPSLVMGIKSIKLFKSAAANGRVKPIPALILGICGTVFGASALYMSVATIMMVLEMVSMIV